MELIDIVKQEEALTELFESKSCKVHEYEGNTLVKYPHLVTLDDGEGGWLKYCRGAVYNEEKEVLVVPPTRFKEGRPENLEDYTIQEYIDGTMINVWFNKKWYISTRGRIGALCSWHTKKTFRHMFLDIINENNGNFDILDQAKGYTFVLVHKDNRIVQKYNGNKVYLVSVWNKETNTYALPTETYNKLKEEYDPWFSIPETLDKSNLKDLSKVQATQNAGYTFISETSRFKEMNPKYEEIKDLHGKSHNMLFNYIENRRNGRLPQFIKIYPEERRECNNFKYKIHDFTQLLYDGYGVVFKEKRCKLTEMPFSMKPLLYALHGEYLETRQPIAFSTVMEYVNSLPSAKLVFVLSRFTSEVKEFIKEHEEAAAATAPNMPEMDQNFMNDIIKKLQDVDVDTNMSDEALKNILDGTVNDMVNSIVTENKESDEKNISENINKIFEEP